MRRCETIGCHVATYFITVASAPEDKVQPTHTNHACPSCGKIGVRI